MRATLEHLAEELQPVAEQAANVPASIQPLLEAINDRAAFVRLLGWLLLDRRPSSSSQPSSPLSGAPWSVSTANWVTRQGASTLVSSSRPSSRWRTAG